MACEGYPTQQTAKTFALDAGTTNEVVTKQQDRTEPASDGKTKKTFWGIENDATLQREEIDQLAETQRENLESTFTAQFSYKRIGNISLYVGDSLPEANKLNSYQFPDDSGEWYGPVQDQVFPITIPADPSSDNEWSLVNALTSDSLPLYAKINYKDSAGKSAFDNVLDGVPLPSSVGDIVSCSGFGDFIRLTKTNPSSASDFESLSELFIDAFIPQGSSELTQGIIDIAYSFSSDVHFKPNKTYTGVNINIPDFGTAKAHPTTTFKKSGNGYFFDLGRRGVIDGGPKFDGSYTDNGYTGNSVVISKGDNSSNKDLQGHQRLYNVEFTNSDEYHVIYPNPNKGWMSELHSCKFLDKAHNSPANVKWPDEPTNGGNRKIYGGYSSGPVCNVSGADNGVISTVEVGTESANLDDQFVYFDGSAVNPAKKIRFLGNRPAIANGKMQVRNAFDCVFESNIFAGSATFEAGVENCVYANTNIQKFFSDFSGKSNVIDTPVPKFFTPFIKAGVTLGNGSTQGEYQRNGSYVDFRIELDIGSTTSVTGTIKFDLPIAVVSGTRVFTGTAWGAGYAGLSYINQGNSDVVVYSTGSSVSTWNPTNPKSWASGDKIIIEGRYRIS